MADAPASDSVTPASPPQAPVDKTAPRAGEVPRDAPPEAKPPEEPKSDGKPTEADRLKELAAQQKRITSERMKLAHEARQKRESDAKREEEFNAREAKIKEAENWEQNFVRDPIRFLSKRLGDTWYDKLSHAKLSGTVTPDMVALDVDERVLGVEKKLLERIGALEKQLTEKETRGIEQQKQEYEASAVAYVKTNAEKYPLIHAFEVLGNIPAVIDAHFNQTSSMDEAGNFVAGEVLTAEQAADLMEKSLDERFSAAAKAKALKQAPKTPPVDQRNPSPQRRTLSTDLTATSNSDSPPPTNEGERIKRAIARWESVSSQNR